MSCSICGRSSCASWMHSIADQEAWDARQSMSDDVDTLRRQLQEAQAEIAELKVAHAEELSSKDTFIRQLGADSALLDWYDQHRHSLHFRYDMRWSNREERYYTGWEPMFRDVQPDAAENTATLREALELERARREKEQKP